MVISNIKKSFQKEKRAVIIRHAERFKMDNMVNVIEAELTEKGRHDSVDFGCEIAAIKDLEKATNILLYHSPIKRCLQTAEGIKKGLGKRMDNSSIAGVMLELGGPYIKGKWQDVAVEIESYGYDVFIRKWFDDEFSPDFIMPLKESVHTIINAIISKLNRSNILTINVTHDLNVLVLREYFFKIRHEELGIPDFLDGIVLYTEENRLFLMYEDNIVSASLPIKLN